MILTKLLPQYTPHPSMHQNDSRADVITGTLPLPGERVGSVSTLSTVAKVFGRVMSFSNNFWDSENELRLSDFCTLFPAISSTQFNQLFQMPRSVNFSKQSLTNIIFSFSSTYVWDSSHVTTNYQNFWQGSFCWDLILTCLMLNRLLKETTITQFKCSLSPLFWLLVITFHRHLTAHQLKMVI